MFRATFAALILSFVVSGCAKAPGGPSAAGAAQEAARTPEPVHVLSHLATESVDGDADDPAIWVHPTDPTKSLILGTDKGRDALFAFDLQGKRVQRIGGIQRPNNVDVETDFDLGGKPTDLAVVTERGAKRLRVFAIDPATRNLSDVSGATAVFEGEPGERAAPMGIALYRRPTDGAVFAIVSRKEGPKEGYLWQYRFVANASGKVDLEKVRAFGLFSGSGEIESVVVDDELGYVYCSDEAVGVRKYHADPDKGSEELALFATYPFAGDREGIGLYLLPEGKGYVVVTEQLDGDTRYHVFRREGDVTPHVHAPVKILAGGADGTDGIEVSSAALGPTFPAGMLVAMNSGKKNFLVFDWKNLADTGSPKLASTR
ncbi:MAG: phytase [Fimbriimonadaceae bacterium]|nr:phytase [Fimbriimonadaceae bacterium]